MNNNKAKFAVILVGAVFLVAVFLFGGFWFYNIQNQQKINLEQRLEDLEAQNQNKIDEESTIERKKQALAMFYNKLVTPTENKDWEGEYEVSGKILKDNITKAQYVSYKEANSPYSLEYIVNDIRVDGDKGYVNRTLIICKTEECQGDNRIEKTAEKEYEYKGNSWQILEIQPSERALSAASFYYIDNISKSEEKKKSYFNNYSYGVENQFYAVSQHAIHLDDNIDELVFLENVISKIKGGNDTTSVSTSGSVPVPSSNNTDSTNFFDEYKQKQAQQCQEDLNKYNVCMNEYNAEMAEYNTCLSENADLNKMFKSYCSKPYKYCYKPLCAY